MKSVWLWCRVSMLFMVLLLLLGCSDGKLARPVTGDSGNSADSVDTGDSGNTGNSGDTTSDTGDSADTVDSGNTSSDTGNSGNSGDTTSDTGDSADTVDSGNTSSDTGDSGNSGDTLPDTGDTADSGDTTPPPPECYDDGDCDDGIFCNGSEVCNVGNCENGKPPCEVGCNEGKDQCDCVVTLVDGTTGGDGSSWDSPLGLFQEAINAASDKIEAGALNCQVWAKQGTYKPEKTIQLHPSVRVFGGFDGTEQQLTQRIAGNVTVVDGKDGTYPHLFVGAQAAQLHDLTLKNHVNKTAKESFGGALFVPENTLDMTVSDVIFDGNGAEGEGNNDQGYIGAGGAIAVLSGSRVTFTRCHFTANTAIGGRETDYGMDHENGYGGALFIENAEVIIRDCVFDSNKATSVDGKGEGHGGAIFATSSADITIVSSVFLKNSADDYGGAVCASDDASVTIEKTKISQSRSNVRGGAVLAIRGASVFLINDLIYNNAAGQYGAGLYAREDSYLYVIHSIVYNNDLDDTSSSRGAGLHVYDNSRADVYNSIFWENSNGPEMRNNSSDNDVSLYNTIVQDSDFSGRDIYRESVFDSEPLFVNVSKGNFHHVSGSPALDKGAGIEKPTDDMDGKKRNLDHPDLGCYEY